jgi:hypothetical protein
MCLGEVLGGAEGNRTPDLLIANEALYHLSYGPKERRRYGPRARSSSGVLTAPCQPTPSAARSSSVSDGNPWPRSSPRLLHHQRPADLLWWAIVISAILSWLFAFDVINRRNQFVYNAATPGPRHRPDPAPFPSDHPDDRRRRHQPDHRPAAAARPEDLHPAGAEVHAARPPWLRSPDSPGRGPGRPADPARRPRRGRRLGAGRRRTALSEGARGQSAGRRRGQRRPAGLPGQDPEDCRARRCGWPPAKRRGQAAGTGRRDAETWRDVRPTP